MTLADRLQGIDTSIKRITEARRQRTEGVGAAFTKAGEALDAETWSLIQDMAGAIRELQVRPPAVDSIERIQPEEGDILLVKLGDKNTGWIPSPEHEGTALTLWNKALRERGLEDKVSVLIYHYGMCVETIRKEDRAKAVRKLIETDQKLMKTLEEIEYDDSAGE
jgi:hypothetical protein